MPDEDLTYVDLIRGEVTFPAGSFPDFVVVRPNGVPLYTFVNPVDDALMGITHVLRGEDLMPSTARQLSLYAALIDAGVTTFVPRFAHMPLVLGETGTKKLSKRDPQADLFLHRERGFIHEGLLNYLALLGWSIGPDRDVFSLDEFIAAFDIENVNPNPARFDQKKAESINGDHIRMLDVKDFAERTVPYLAAAGLFDEPTHEQLVLAFRAAPLVQERVQLLGDVPGMVGFLFRDEVSYDEDALKGLPANAAEVLDACVAALEPVDDFTPESIQDALSTALVENLELKPRVAYGPPRVAITGRRVSPPLFESMELLGKEESLRRLRGLSAFLAR